jgi:hypothetical protein
MRKRRWNTIGLRGLMLVVLVIGLWLGWAVHRARQQREAVKAVQTFGGFVHYDWEFANGPVIVPPGNSLWKPSWGKLKTGPKPWAPGWLRRAIGDEYFQNIAHVSLFVDIEKGRADATFASKGPADEALRKLSTQTRIQTLQLGGQQVTEENLVYLSGMTGLEELLISWGMAVNDESIAPIARLTNLRELTLTLTKLTDKGLKQLGRLRNLERLQIEGSGFSNEGLTHIRGLTHLKSLSLTVRDGNNTISDEGLDGLLGMTQLETLYVYGWHVTEKGLAKLQGLKGLKAIYIEPQALSKEAKERLKSAMPNLKEL